MTATEALRVGLLAVVPTETVYGLAASLDHPAAVARIFAVKGRPPGHPLIVHVPDEASARGLAARWPDTAARLASLFWPGPVTIIVPRGDRVPDEVVAGGATVGLRVPAHPLFLELLREVGPVAAPSANRFSRLSPTRVEHLDPEILAAVAAVMDGGPSESGIESTVIDLSGEAPLLRRPGPIGQATLEAALGQAMETDMATPGHSPGTHPAHYRPSKPLAWAQVLHPDQSGLTFDPPEGLARQVLMPSEPTSYARILYDVLHALDADPAVREIFVQILPRGAEWAAVADRLRRAARPGSIEIS